MARTSQSVPISFEGGLEEYYEDTLLPDGTCADLENWIPEPTGGLRCRRGWRNTITEGTPATRQIRGIGELPAPTTYATPTRRAFGEKQASDVSSLSTTWSEPTIAGNHITAVVFYKRNAGSTSLTVPAGLVSISSPVSNSPLFMQMFYISNAAVQSGNWKFDFGNRVDRAFIGFYEWPGIDTTLTLDKTVSDTGTALFGDTGTTATTALASELWFGFAGRNGEFTPDAFQTPFSVQTRLTGGFSWAGTQGGHPKWDSCEGAAGYKAANAIGTARMTLAGPNPNPAKYVGQIATFKALPQAGTSFDYFVANKDSPTAYTIYRVNGNALESGAYISTDASIAVTDANQHVPFAIGLGNIFYTTPDLATLKRWNGTAVSAVTGSPSGRSIAFYKNRVWVAGKIATPSRLYYSELGDATSGAGAWPANNFIDIDKDDGEAIEDIQPVEEGLLVAKRNSLHIVSGSGPETFRRDRLSGGGAAPGRSICVTPYGVLIAGPKHIWFWAGGRVELFSRSISESYEWSGAFMSTAYADGVAYICDEGSGKVWAYDLVNKVWWKELVSENTEAPAFVFSYQDTLLYGPKAATAISLLAYRKVTGPREKDTNIGETFKVETPEMLLGGAAAPATPKNLYITLRQRGGDASETGLTVTPIYDGEEQGALTIEPVNGAPRAFRTRLDVGRSAFYSVRFRLEQTLNLSHESLMDVEALELLFDQEERR